MRMPKINWCDLEEVKAFADMMGKGMSVVKHKSRPNYNITHTERRDLWDVPDCTVLYTT